MFNFSGARETNKIRFNNIFNEDVLLSMSSDNNAISDSDELEDFTDDQEMFYVTDDAEINNRMECDSDVSELSESTDLNLRLFNKSTMSLKEASMLLLTFKLRFSLSNVCFEMLLNLLKQLLPYDNVLPTTLKGLKKIINKTDPEIKVNFTIMKSY